MSSPKKAVKLRPNQRTRRPDPTLTVLGPVPNLEEHVSPEWWSAIFNSLYLKEKMTWNYLVGFGLMLGAVFFVFKKW